MKDILTTAVHNLLLAKTTTINCSKALPIFKAIIFTVLLFAAQQTYAIYTVTNTNDNGFGSLRYALDNSEHIIEFNIPGAGVHTITRGAVPYPTITGSFSIDGTTQPGYAGVPLIEINANGDTYGLDIAPSFFANYNFTVRGLIINRASSHGIRISPNSSTLTHTTITGCYIGTNSSGTTDLGNGGNGISITGSFAIIGGTGLGERNIISGNNGSGISFVASYSIEIYNNYIGTNASGTADLGNTVDGIFIGAASSTDPNIIGGTSGGGVNRGNVISGNNGNGIRLNTSSPITIQRNLIGTSSNGTADLGNSKNGILIGLGTAHLIGSSTSATDRNIISGNGGAAGEGNGIKLLPNSISSEISGTQIFGNRIGTNSAGTAILQNDGDGIEINDSNDNQIGLAGSNTARNTISGNNFNGISISGATSTGNVIQYNSIGTNQLLDNLGNKLDGIKILSGGSNTIGGAAGDKGNTIAYNGGVQGHGINLIGTVGNVVQFNTIFSNTYSGVVVSGSGSTGNGIKQNSIYGNQVLGIDLEENGVTLNDLNDTDTGANLLQNYPVLQSVTPSRIVGSLNSIADQTFTIDFYRVDSCNSSGNGEGRYYLASTNVTTVGNNVSFNFAYAGLNVGEIVTATATDAGGNTSEFSQCRTVANTGDLQLSASTYNVNENVGTATITVNRVGASNGTVTVDYATSNGTATAGQDYTATSGTLTFLNGETTKTFPVPINDDTMDEPSEFFNVALSNPTGGALLVAPSTATVTIADNDNPPTISITDVSLEEGNSGTTNFNFNVTLSQASGFDISVNYATVNGTATAGSDYASANGTVNFSSALAETSKNVTIAVQGELLIEINETFFVNLTTPVNATIFDSQGLGTILDDDNPGVLQFSTSPYTTTEGSNFVFITVTRTNGDAGTVTVDYATTGGTATPASDYTATSGTLILSDGATSEDFRVAILQDTEVEPTETFNVVLSNPIGGATLGPLSTTTVNILDDDSGPTISGTVTYGNAAAPPKYISNVTVTGVGSPNVFTTTAAPGGTAGQYTLTGFGAGAYTVSLAKTTGVNGINSFDAARVAQHVAGTGAGPFVTNEQRISADVTNNGVINSFDAAKIAQYAAGLPLVAPNLSGVWRFFVPGPAFPLGASPTSRTYASVTSNITGDDYVGLLVGEVTGNWTPSAARAVGSKQLAEGSAGGDARVPAGPERGIAVELPDVSVDAGKEVVIPVNVQSVSDRGVISYQFDLRYDPSVIQPVADVADVKGTASRGLVVVTNATEPGLLRVVVYGAMPIDKDGVLLNLRFAAVGAAGGVSPISFERIMFNEGGPRVTVVDGRVELF